MKTSTGFSGAGVRADVRIEIEDSEQPEVAIESTVASMYGSAIERQVRSILGRFGDPNLRVHVDDCGALPFVIEARLEAALASHLNRPLPSVQAPTRVRPRSRMRRSRLYVPGNSPKLMVNCGLYRADSVVLDLEDSVPPAEKLSARALVRQALVAVDFGGSECAVRINGGPSGLEDVATLAPVQPDVFLVPKAEDPGEVMEIDALLNSLGCDAQVIAILESAKGVLRAFEIATASTRVVGLTLGIEDYLADIGATERHAADWANGMILNAARAAGIVPLASVCSTIDAETMEAYAREMAAMGFEGVGCIHPAQIAAAHRGFEPSVEQAEMAEEIVAAFERAVRAGSGVVSVHGKMVDAPVYARAKRTLERAGRADPPC